VAVPVTDTISLDDAELEERFFCAGGPGGQHANKTDTAVQLRLDVRRSPSLPEPVRARLERLAGSRLTAEGVLVITAHRFRSQERNRADALARLVELIRRAAEPPPPPRKPTRPSKSARLKRLQAKTARGGVKALRGKPSLED
jgi:ribosome-associated protein